MVNIAKPRIESVFTTIYLIKNKSTILLESSQRYALGTHSKATKPSKSDIIASKVKGLDLREHPSKYKHYHQSR